MLTNGIRIHGHSRSEESIKLLREHLVTLHIDKDDNSLFVRFNELTRRIEELEIMVDVNWNCFIAAAKKSEELTKELKDE
jgi:hypothetical protein